MNLREHVRRVQLLENAAAGKAGMRFRLLEEDKLLGSGHVKYIKKYVSLLEADIAKEVLQSAKLGKELFNAITK
ncbi:MAG TPA: hypothetical protein ENN61_03010 [Bacteroidaceae bacterium]|nr:hypothetical protein [Bacteroidaceae bacterium]